MNSRSAGERNRRSPWALAVAAVVLAAVALVLTQVPGDRLPDAPREPDADRRAAAEVSSADIASGDSASGPSGQSIPLTSEDDPTSTAGGAGSVTSTAAVVPTAEMLLAAVDGTGADDVTWALQQVVDAVPDGGTLRLPSDARYRIEGTLSVEGRRGLTIEGDGATLVATTKGRPNRFHVLIQHSSGIVIRDLHVVGANPQAGAREGAYHPGHEWQHGFTILSSHDVTLDGVGVSRVYGDLVYIGQDGAGPWSENVTIENSTLTHSGRQGIAVVAARDVFVRHNVIDEVARASIDLEPAGPHAAVDGVTVSDNRFGPSLMYFLAAGSDRPVDNVTVSGNEGFGGRALKLAVVGGPGASRRNWTVVDNVGVGAADWGRAAQTYVGVDGLVVRGNVQAVLPGLLHGVLVQDSCNFVVEDNHFPNSRGELLVEGTC